MDIIQPVAVLFIQSSNDDQSFELPDPDKLKTLYEGSIQASQRVHDWYINSFGIYTHRDAAFLKRNREPEGATPSLT